LEQNDVGVKLRGVKSDRRLGSHDFSPLSSKYAPTSLRVARTNSRIAARRKTDERQVWPTPSNGRPYRDRSDRLGPAFHWPTR
jgi:hypothetical protein